MGRRDRWRMSGSVLRLSPFLFTSSNSCNIPSVSWIYFTWCNLHDWQTSSQNVVSSTLRVHSCLAKGIVWTGTLKFNFYIFDRPWSEAPMLIHIITSLTKTILVPKRKRTKASEWLLLSATCNLMTRTRTWLFDLMRWRLCLLVTKATHWAGLLQWRVIVQNDFTSSTMQWITCESRLQKKIMGSTRVRVKPIEDYMQ